LLRIEKRLAEMKGGHDLLAQRIGEPSDDGLGGTGLVGEVAALKKEVGGLLSLKSKAVGLLAGVAAATVILALGLKGAVTAAVAGVGGLFGG
jgi:hypothetical protein